jgi:hypothetical protein
MWGDPFLLKMEQFLDRPVQWSTAARVNHSNWSIDLLYNDPEKQTLLFHLQ